MAAAIATASHNLWYQEKLISSSPELKGAGAALSSDIWPWTEQEGCSGKGDLETQLAALVAGCDTAQGWVLCAWTSKALQRNLFLVWYGIKYSTPDEVVGRFSCSYLSEHEGAQLRALGWRWVTG